ncbi:MAG: thioesterase family protein [Halioglobus sp.]|nr:thioesterase family protein [Halioglobus sp.]
MNLYLRLLVAVIRGLLRPKAPVSHVAESRFRVMPHDIDVFGHMNNGRYLQIMDVARAEWMARAGVLGAMWRNRWSAMLGGTTVRFRRSLSPFQRYIVRTRLLCYDSDWFYLEHAVITVSNTTVAVGVPGRPRWWSLASTGKVMSQIEPNVVSAPMAVCKDACFRQSCICWRPRDSPVGIWVAGRGRASVRRRLPPGGKAMEPSAMDRPETGSPRLYALFHAITGHPRFVIVLGTLVILGMLLGLKDLVKDTSVDALIPPDHVSFKTNQRSKEIFGIADPIIIALLADDVFAPERLELIATLHSKIEQLPNVRGNSMYSLASESSIEGLPDRIDAAQLSRPPAGHGDRTSPHCVRGWRRWRRTAGTLVSEDGAGAIIAVELIDTRAARDTYAKIADLVRSHDNRGMDVHISGMAAVSGYLSTAIDRDSRVMQPIIFVVVLAIVYLAFRSALATSLPVLVIIASAGGALGVMAWAGVPYFTITSALPVILVAVSVADAIHDPDQSIT